MSLKIHLSIYCMYFLSKIFIEKTNKTFNPWGTRLMLFVHPFDIAEDGPKKFLMGLIEL